MKLGKAEEKQSVLPKVVGKKMRKIKCFAQKHFEKGSTDRKMGKMRKYVEIFAQICG